MFRGTDLILRLRSYRDSHKLLYVTATMLFFWSIFDGIISYVTPLIITGEGYSNTEMGLIYGTSSISGALFDLVLVKILKNTHFRRLYLFMFLVSFIYPLILWNAKTLPLYLVVMAVWGIYYDLRNFGTSDFISRYSPQEENASSFGVVGLFRIFGYLIAPILAGLVVSEAVNPKPLYIAVAALLFSFMTFMFLTSRAKREQRLIETDVEKSLPIRSTFIEVLLLRKISFTLITVLVFIMFISLFDAFFWTVGPLYSHNIKWLGEFEGVLMTVYLLPSIFAYLFVGKLTRRFGKKRTAFTSLMLGSLALMFLWFEPNSIFVLGIVFCSSMLSAWAWPAIDGAFSDYLSETELFDKEVNSLSDLFVNMGWILGPSFAGIVSDLVGIERSFAMLGLLGVIICSVLLYVAPRSIKIEENVKEFIQ